MYSRLPALVLTSVAALTSVGMACTNRPKTSPPRPIIRVVCITPTVYRIYINGYTTIANRTNTFCTCGIGLGSATGNVITGVTGASIIDNSTGRPLSSATGAPFFPFQLNSNNSRAWSALFGPTSRSFGFLAPVTGRVPGYVCVCFCFTITVNPTATNATVLSALRTARVGGDEANSNGTLRGGSHRSLVAAGGASNACILYYKWNRGVGGFVPNYGTAGVAPPFGMLVKGTSPASGWGPGQFGGGQRGSSNTSSTSFVYTDSGWRGGIAGSISLHFWCKQRNAPGTSLSYINSNLNSWRLFTNGVAGQNLWFRAWNTGTTTNIILPQPTGTLSFQRLAARTQGVCVGLTINAATDRAQWYIDGAPRGAAIALPAATAGVLVGASTNSYKVGRHSSNTSSWAYDTDEYKLCNFAATAAQMKAWHAASWAGWGQLGRPWGLWHGCIGGPPKLGSTTYGLTLNGPPNSRVLVVVGARPLPEFDMGIIFPYLRNCPWFPAFDIQVIAALNSAGELLIPARIPNSTGLIGQLILSQSLGLPPGATQLIMSNGNATSIERN